MTDDTRGQAVRRIVAAATAMLEGNTSYIEGARVITSARFPAQVENDPDILPFVGIDSETDALPMGEVKRLWKPEALAALVPEIEEAERWARNIAEPICRRLIERFS